MTSLEELFSNAPGDDFPNGDKSTYSRRYESLANELAGTQREAAVGALVQQVKKAIQSGREISHEDLIYLNDHGPDHIACVQQRCHDLIMTSKHRITGYECYLLLAAIQLHDAGNIHGRDGHEKQVPQLIRSLGKLLGSDTAEKDTIGRIAIAHGGKRADSKDTLRALQQKTPLLFKQVRPRFLAALLRLGDELADDSTRASRYALENAIIPEYSEIYHRYSLSLHSVGISADAIELKYFIDSDIAQTKFSHKKNKKAYLIDEIYRRLAKMHCERNYCMNNLRPHIYIDKIRFEIEIDHPTDPLERGLEFSAVIEDCGYPGTVNLAKLCPQVETNNGVSICQKIKLLAKKPTTTIK